MTLMTLNSRYVADISYWFWYRESWTAILTVVAEIYAETWDDPPAIWKLRTWFELLLVPLLAIILILFAGAPICKRNAIRAAKDQHELPVYNKKNIEYFTMLNHLYGVE